jgi:anti-sigma regulatory factor (Ser/Thr protein kinase)
MLCPLLIDSSMYFTMIYLFYDRQRQVVRLVSAGHTPAYLYSAAGRVPLEATGPPVGWDPDDSWGVAEYPLARGDSILLYTDGLVESRNDRGALCGDDLFAGLGVGMPPEAMVDRVMAAAESFCSGRFDDDVTVFALRAEAAENCKSLTYSLEPAFSSADAVRRDVAVAMQEWFGDAGAGATAADFCQVIGELVNNAVEHGECTVMEAKLRLDGEGACFTLVTDGKPFDTTAGTAAMPDFDADGELPEGGFGLAIIRKLSDSLHYEFRDGKNITEVSKIFKGELHGTQN